MARKRKPSPTRPVVAQPPELAEAIDAARGKTPRNRWINEACVLRLGLPLSILRGPGKPRKPESA